MTPIMQLDSVIDVGVARTPMVSHVNPFVKSLISGNAGERNTTIFTLVVKKVRYNGYTCNAECFVIHFL